MVFVRFFFFKQKTAYEFVSGDWSSDVCSSDLVRGASKGEGLGNQFLANIRETDAVIQVVRCFDDENIIHVEGSVNPVRDIETIQIELALADLASVEKRRDKAQRSAKSGDKDAKREL